MLLSELGPTVHGSLVWDADHYTRVVEAVRRAKVSVWIATANLKDVHVRTKRGRYASVLADFDALAGRGVELRILHAAMPSRRFRDAFDRFPRLCSGGLELRQCPRIHLKLVVVDGAWLYLGSANWTGAGLGAKGENRRNFELGLWSRDERALDDVQDRFDRLWRGGACRDCKLRSECEAPLDVSSRAPGATKIVRITPPNGKPNRKRGGSALATRD